MGGNFKHRLTLNVARAAAYYKLWEEGIRLAQKRPRQENQGYDRERNSHISCAIRRRLRIGILCDGAYHSKMGTNSNSRLNTRRTWMASARRHVCTEAGGLIPDHNVERQLARTRLPVPSGDQRRIDLIVPCFNVAR
eukprot:1234486-Pyramimonas_sp.AAC.1